MRSNKYETRICKICGEEYKPSRYDQYTCGSPECAKERRRLYSLKWADEHRGEVREHNRRYMKRIREERAAKADTIIAIGYADRQMEATLKMAGRVKTEL